MDTPAELDNHILRRKYILHKYMLMGFVMGTFIGILVMIPLYYFDSINNK